VEFDFGLRICSLELKLPLWVESTQLGSALLPYLLSVPDGLGLLLRRRAGFSCAFTSSKSPSTASSCHIVEASDQVKLSRSASLSVHKCCILKLASTSVILKHACVVCALCNAS
jgi:hypothetical protein